MGALTSNEYCMVGRAFLKTINLLAKEKESSDKCALLDDKGQAPLSPGTAVTINSTKFEISLCCTALWYSMGFTLHCKTIKTYDYVDSFCSVFYAFPYV